MTGRWPIPASWQWARAATLAEVVGGGTPRTTDPDHFTGSPDGAIAWLTPADLSGHAAMLVHHGARYLTPRGHRASAARLLPAGSVVFSSRAPIGRCAIAGAPLCTSQGFRSFVLRTPEVASEYLYLYLLASRDHAHSLASGSTFKELSGTRAGQMWVPVAPAAEQRRIVAKVQAVRARCTRAGALLAAVPGQLATLRQAILGAALRGQASAAWRGQDDASQDIDGLPGTWRRVALGEVARVQPGFAFKSAWYRDAGVRLLRGSNVAPQRVRWDDVVFLDPAIARGYAAYMLSAGDIVIAMDRPLVADGLKVGRIATADLPCLLVQRVARLIPGDAISSDYLALALQGRQFCAHLGARATGTALPHVSADDIASAPLAVPPLAEQRVIVDAVRVRLEHLAAATRLHARLSGALADVEQAALARAFRGELVAQDPADEPAAAIVARLVAR